MTIWHTWGMAVLCSSVVAATSLAAEPAAGVKPMPHWTPAGWGGGGFYYSAAFHPTQDGVIYLGGDVGGLYKSTDHGKSWKMINNGIADYGVFSLAVDPTNPQTVYAATAGGLCKSTDGGESWTTLPKTGTRELRITGEKGKSIRSIAVDPADSSIVYAGSPAGKVYKSTDGGQTWNAVWSPKSPEGPAELKVQFGKVNADYFGGVWMPLQPAAKADGIALTVRREEVLPRELFITVRTGQAVYRSRTITDFIPILGRTQLVLRADDFTPEPEFAKANPQLANDQPKPDFGKVIRLDLSAVGDLPAAASVLYVSDIAFTVPGSGKPDLAPAIDLAANPAVRTYGNVQFTLPVTAAGGDAGTVYSVAIDPNDPTFILAATSMAGLQISEDAGETWRKADAPAKASSASVSPTDGNVIYAGFFEDGIYRSADRGKTWANVPPELPAGTGAREVVVSSTNPQNVFAIATGGWSGFFYRSSDGGKTWARSSEMSNDPGNPTLPQEPNRHVLSSATNLAVSPGNPDQMYISANWRSCYSENGGKTWQERMNGADISVITDIRFSGNRVYASAMDEGTLVSDDNGKTWRQLWPLKWTPEISGHNWRLSVTPVNGVDRIVATVSPWEAKFPNRVIVSEDGGKTFKVVTDGLPTYIPRANTMWGQGYARSLAADPTDPKTLYLGIDGDPADGNTGGGVFKSTDGGLSWKQLPNQPGSRRGFYGLAVDPKSPNRLYWATAGDKGGLYSSEDGGDNWEPIFSGDQWLFNTTVGGDGAIYAGGSGLYRSDTAGKTWWKATEFEGVIVAIEVHPKDPKTIWIATTTWEGSAQGAIYKTTDSGLHWQEITGDIPYRKPLVLRYNPATSELWAGGTGLYRIKQ